MGFGVLVKLYAIAQESEECQEPAEGDGTACTPVTVEELVAFCDNARREFYLRPGYLFAKALQAVSHPGEIKRLFKGFFSLVRYLFKPSIKKSTIP